MLRGVTPDSLNCRETRRGTIGDIVAPDYSASGSLLALTNGRIATDRSDDAGVAGEVSRSDELVASAANGLDKPGRGSRIQQSCTQLVDRGIQAMFE